MTISEAVMNRSLGALSDWLEGQSPLFLTFHNQVKYLGRAPQETGFDQQRKAAEAAINPWCFEELSFAALTLDGRGMDYYGPYSVILKALTIEHRASVFERNPFFFNQEHRIIAGAEPPSGYRATWGARGTLAVAKLHGAIQTGCERHRYPDILMGPDRASEHCDFVEVHIYGPVHRGSIQRIVGPTPKRRPDRATWRRVMGKAEQFGIDVMVTS